MRSDFRIFVAGVAVIFLAACNGCFGCQSPVNQPGNNLNRTCDQEPPPLQPQKLDVLFVVDNSGSMREEQEAVARELTLFVDQLRVAGGVQQDIRVGVITTTVYQHIAYPNPAIPAFYADCPSRGWYCTESGLLQPVPTLGADGGFTPGMGSQRVLDDEDPEFVPKFARLVQVGVNGSGQETPFEAIFLALTPPLSQRPVEQGGNGGFLRDGARLLFVVVTDEDDCSEKFDRPSKVTVGQLPDRDYCREQGNSLTPVSEYHRIFTEDIKDTDGNTKEIVYTVIGPVGRTNKTAMSVLDTVITPDGGSYQQVRNDDCPTSIEPGFRHRAMAESFDTSLANLDSICKADYRQTLIEIANLAGVSQTINIGAVPDPHMLRVFITRADGKVSDPCTLDNGGLISYDPPTKDDNIGRLRFGASCLRRRDDLKIQLEMFCVY